MSPKLINFARDALMFSSTPYNIEEICSSSSLFEKILSLRQLAYAHPVAAQREKIDDYSWHFVAVSGEKVIGALRVTARKNGRLESENAYPSWVLENFGDQLGAASRMCIDPSSTQISGIPLALTEFAWRRALERGIRIDVTKARLKAIPFYMRMGYLFVRDSLFSFDKWDAICGVIALPADPKHPSKLSSLFADLVQPCELRNSPFASLFTDSYQSFTASASEFIQKSA